VSDIIDIDPALRALDALAADFAEPGPAGAACAQAWPLLAVPTDLLSPLDLDARDRHLARCARCRVAFAEDALDPTEHGAGARAPRPEVLPVATALPALPPPPRRRRAAIAIGAGMLASAAAAAIVITAAGGGSHSTTPAPPVTVTASGGAVPATPIDLVVLADPGALAVPAIDPYRSALRTVAASLPPGSRLTVAVAAGAQVSAVWHTTIDAPGVLPDVSLTMPPMLGPFGPLRYASALDGVGAIFGASPHRRALLLIGDLCATNDHEADAAADRLTRLGVAMRGVAFRVPGIDCGSSPRFPIQYLVVQADEIEEGTVRTANQLLDDARAADVIFVDHPAAPHDR
jgi:hypothetical protein